MGQSRLAREGTPGEGQRLLMVAYVNGNPVHQLQISDTVLRSPQSAIMAYGNVTSASRGGQTFHFRNTLEVLATAYSARQGRRAYTGALCQFGEVAVDPRSTSSSSLIGTATVGASAVPRFTSSMTEWALRDKRLLWFKNGYLSYRFDFCPLNWKINFSSMSILGYLNSKASLEKTSKMPCSLLGPS